MAYTPIITLTFYTHGGFEFVKNIWQGVQALINSDYYKAIMVLTFILSFYIAVTAGAFRHLTTGRASPSSWMAAALGGIIMFYFFFGGAYWKGTPLGGRLVIYDDVTDQQTNVDYLPPGLVLVAGLSSDFIHMIEQTVINSYTLTGAGTPYDLVMSVKMAKDMEQGFMQNLIFAVLPAQIQTSILNYINDVASLVAAHDQGLANDIFVTGTDVYSDTFTRLTNPLLYTTVYVTPSGTLTNTAQIVDGVTAANSIKAWFTKSKIWQKIRDTICAKYGFSATTLGISECSQIIEDIPTSILGVTQTTDTFLNNWIMASNWTRWSALNNNPLNLAVTQSVLNSRTSGVLSGLASAAELIPHIKIVFAALLAGLTPLLLLIVVSTNWLDGVKTLIGLWGWYLCWAAVDVLILCMWANYMQSFVQHSAFYGTCSINSLAMLNYLGSQVLGILGGFRLAGLTISSLLCYAVFKFGGSAIAYVARSVDAQTEGGIKAGAQALMPEAGLQNQLLHEYREMPANIAGAGFNPLDLYQEYLGNMMERVAKGKVLSGYSMSTLQDLYGKQVASLVGYASGITTDQAFDSGALRAYRDVAQINAWNQLLNDVQNDSALKSELASLGIQVGEAGWRQKIFDLAAAGAVASGFARNASQFAQLMKEGKLPEELNRKFLELGKQLASYETLRNQLFNKDYLTEEDLNELALNIGKVIGAQNSVLATLGKMNAEDLTRLYSQEELNPLWKHALRLSFQEYLLKGELSPVTQRMVSNLIDITKKLSGEKDVGAIINHHGSMQFSLDEGTAELLYERLGMPVKAGDRVKINFAIGDKGKYDLVLTTGQEKAELGSYSRRIRLGAKAFNVSAQEYAEAGGVETWKKGKISLKEGGFFQFDLLTGVKTADGRGVEVTEFSGTFKGSAEKFEFMLKGMGLWDRIKINSEAWEKVKSALNSGKEIGLKFKDGELLVNYGGKTKYEKLGSYEVKRLNDTQDLYRSGAVTESADYHRFDNPVMLTLNYNPATGRHELTRVAVQGYRKGHILHADSMWLVTQNGEKIPLPISGDFYISGGIANVGKAFRKAEEGRDALPIDTARSEILQNKQILSGGASADSMSVTEALHTVENSHLPNASEQLKAEGEQLSSVLFHSTDTTQYAYAMAFVDDLGGLIKRQYGIDLEGKLQGFIQLGFDEKTKDSIWGWIANKLTGVGVEAKAVIRTALQKAAKENTGIDILKSAALNIWRSEDLSDEEKAKALLALQGYVIHLAERATKGVSTFGAPLVDRSLQRVLTGIIPGVEVGAEPGAVVSAFLINSLGETGKEVWGFLKHYFTSNHVDAKAINGFVYNMLVTSGIPDPAQLDKLSKSGLIADLKHLKEMDPYLVKYSEVLGSFLKYRKEHPDWHYSPEMVENFLDIAARHGLTSQDRIFEALNYLREHNITDRKQIEKVIENKDYESWVEKTEDKIKSWF